MNRYSHNRALMWDMVMNEVNIGNYVVFGSGPGSQQDEFGQIANRQRQSSNFNMNYAFHALPLQLIVEIGFVLTLILDLIFMIWVLWKFTTSFISGNYISKNPTLKCKFQFWGNVFFLFAYSIGLFLGKGFQFKYIQHISGLFKGSMSSILYGRKFEYKQRSMYFELLQSS